MSRLRITCKAPPSTAPSAGFPRLNDFIPCWTDMCVTLVDDAGVEHAITNVTGLTFSASEGSELPKVTLDFCDVELDVELEADDADLQRAQLAEAPR